MKWIGIISLALILGYGVGWMLPHATLQEEIALLVGGQAGLVYGQCEQTHDIAPGLVPWLQVTWAQYQHEKKIPLENGHQRTCEEYRQQYLTWQEKSGVHQDDRRSQVFP